MKEEKKQIIGHVLACGTQMMWGATFVATKVLLAREYGTDHDLRIECRNHRGMRTVFCSGGGRNIFLK